MAEPVATARAIPVSGLHRFRSRRSSRSLCGSLTRAGVRCFLVDLRGVSDKPAAVRTMAAAIGAPGSHGRNWDAFEEAVRDLSWARSDRYVVIVTGGAALATSEPMAWATVIDILRGAVVAWAEVGVPMAVLVRGAPVGEAPSSPERR